jgi:hypothetical protein
MFPWSRALARRLLPASRYSRILVACALVAALVSWCLWYRPWEAHYQGRPSSHWAYVLLAEVDGKPGRSGNATATDSLLDSIRTVMNDAFEPGQASAAEFEPVLEELLRHRNPDVRRIAAQRLANYGDRGFRNALPILLERLRGHPDAKARLGVARTIRSLAYRDRNALRSRVAEILACHRDEASQSIRNEIVELLRATDPEAVDGLPEVHDLVFIKTPWGRNLADGWQMDSDTGPAGMVWKLVADRTSPSRADYVLAQLAGSTDTAIHSCLATQSIHVTTTPLNVEISVRIKAIAGDREQGGGIVWNHLGPGNYYAAGLNALDGSIRLFKVLDGNGVELASKRGLDVSVGEWHKLTVQHVGPKIWCSLDDTKCLEISDASIQNQGTFGLWTRADAKTHFDGMRLTDFGPRVIAESR